MAVHLQAELLSHRFGESGWYAGAFAMILTNFCGLVFTIIMIGNMLTPIVGLGTDSDTLCSGWLWDVIVTVVVLTHMVLCIKNTSALDKASEAAVGVLLAVTIHLAAEPSDRATFGSAQPTTLTTEPSHQENQKKN